MLCASFSAPNAIVQQCAGDRVRDNDADHTQGPAQGMRHPIWRADEDVGRRKSSIRFKSFITYGS